MRLDQKMMAVTAILAVSILAGCGSAASSSSVASSAAGSEPASNVAASSEATGQNVVEPITVNETIDALQNGDGPYMVHAGITEVSDDGLTLEVYAYDTYEPDDLASLKAGDVLRTHNEQTGELEDVAIDSIEQDEYGDYNINGGLENGGMDLARDGGVFRTQVEDDYPVYYKVGDVTLPLAEDAMLEDSSADPDASIVTTTGAADVASAIADNGDWSAYNTTVFVQDGHVFDIQHIWVP